MVLTFGMELQYLNIFGKHEDVFKFKIKQTGLDLDDVTETYTIQKHIYRAYGFTEYAWNFDIVETVSTNSISRASSWFNFTDEFAELLNTEA
jgi:hypothetical protein